ncbi:acyltransferase [Kosakonia quasisacchari]|uniref:Acyltransferase n=1 Tax=Kosakonia quasisacchari TaxID=2529380 RepID=A0A4R0H856_9ENTR|nr:acyltransferase [Kosakonia quasisacchari]TCC04752.1 acyltransferase [Kosakonia quasisacchari]
MLIYKIKGRLRALYYNFTRKLSIRILGSNPKIFGAKYMKMTNCSIGDNCWIQAVAKYKTQNFTPEIIFGENVMMSCNVHISAVKKIDIGDNVLLGSNIYIGDHSHGSTRPAKYEAQIPPAFRDLDDIAEIKINDNTWVCDNVVILAGTFVGKGSIIAANSVVKGHFEENSLIAGNPARFIRKLTNG